MDNAIIYLEKLYEFINNLRSYSLGSAMSSHLIYHLTELEKVINLLKEFKNASK